MTLSIRVWRGAAARASGREGAEGNGPGRTATRARLLMALAATVFALATSAALSPVAAAGPCQVQVDGRDVPLEGSPSEPVLVGTDQEVVVEESGGVSGDTYRVTLEYFGIPIELTHGVVGAGDRLQTTIKSADYAWLGVGLYRLVGESNGAAPCRVVVYIQIQGSPLGSVGGLAGIALAVVGSVVMVASLVAAWRGSRRPPKGGSSGGGAEASVPPDGVPIGPAAARLRQLETLSERARARRLAREVAAGATATALGAFGGKALVTRAVGRGVALPAIDAYEVVLDRPIDQAGRDELSRIGTEIIGFVPPATYRLVLTAAQAGDLVALGFARELRRYGLDQTVTETVLDRTTGPGDGRTPILFDCIVHRETDLPGVLAAIAEAPELDLVQTGRDVARILAPPQSAGLAEIADRLDVRRVVAYEPPRLMSDHGRVIIGIDGIAATDDRPPVGWTGEGELVAIFDSGIDLDHPDLAGRVATAKAAAGASDVDLIGHGTHVAGIVAGSGAASNGKIRGVAPGARLVSYGVVGPGERLILPADLGDLLVHAVDLGAKIINLSWGVAALDGYDSGARDIDRFVVEHPDVLVVIAAGNGGQAPEGRHLPRTVYSPAWAKNALTVGASDTDRIDHPAILWGEVFRDRFPKPPASDEPVTGDRDLPAAISGRGPTKFESVKPDLLAPGTDVLSARAANFGGSSWRDDSDFGGHYVYLTGTSASAPFVAGAAAVVRQYLRSTFALEPSAALLKAVLVGATRRLPPRGDAGAGDVGYPDFDQGFGCLDLRILFDPGARPVPLRVRDVAQTSEGALDSRAPAGSPHAAMARYSIDVAVGRPLRVTLAWTDWPGAYIYNNLQLEVTGPQVHRSGNDEHHYPRNAAMVDRPSDGVVFDKRNNIEQVTVARPVAGTYEIRVLAGNCSFPPQGYGLSVTGELASALRDERPAAPATGSGPSHG